MPLNPIFPNRNLRPITLNASSRAVEIKTNLWNIKSAQPSRLVDGVFEGGGALGAAYIGALRALHDNDIWFARVAGNSAGSITAAMIAVGFTAAEMQWLSSGYPNVPQAPQSLTACGIRSPIPFSDFLDLPTLNSVSANSMRKTLLWNALKGTVVDEVAKIRLPIVSRNQLADRLVDAVLDFGLKNVPVLGDLTIRELFRQVPGNQSDPLKAAMVAALSAAQYPQNPPEVGDFVPMVSATAPFRTQFADTVWTAVARNMPVELLITNLLHEGSIFEGDAFLATLRELFGRKVHNNPSATVLFKDLKLPLALIAADTDQSRMVVYSSRTNANMEVVEAVRRSMSVPFVFQPRGPNKNIVDGGLCSNFPLWLFMAGGQNYVTQLGNDDTRPKVGFVLEESLAAKPVWNVQPPKFTPAGQPPKVDDMTVVRPILLEKLKALGIQPPGVSFPESAMNQHLVDLKLIEEISGVMGIDKETSTHEVITKGLMAGLTYFDVVLPLLGYHWLDFHVNEDEDDILAMWDRGWHAAMDALGVAPSTGTGQPLIANANAQQSPYRVF